MNHVSSNLMCFYYILQKSAKTNSFSAPIVQKPQSSYFEKKIAAAKNVSSRFAYLTFHTNLSSLVDMLMNSNEETALSYSF